MKEEGRRYEAIARLAGAKISGDVNPFPGWYVCVLAGVFVVRERHVGKRRTFVCGCENRLMLRVRESSAMLLSLLRMRH